MMKKYILATIAAAIFAAPNSHASDAAVYCEALANLTETAAIARDQGTPAAKLQAIAATQRHLNAEIRALAIYLVDAIYNDKYLKRMSPEQVRAAAFVVCLKNRR